MAKYNHAQEPHVSLRVNVPIGLYERIGAYRHEARHETRAQAVVTLLAAGLAALAKPVALPQPDRPKRLVPFAGADDDEGAPAMSRRDQPFADRRAGI